MKIENICENGLEINRITNNDGVVFSFSPHGAALLNIFDGENYLTRSVEDYKDFYRPECFYGKTIGRVANRIKGNKFRLNDEIYILDNNEENNVLHGGREGLSNKDFDYSIDSDDKNIILTYSYLSKDLEGGFPGNLFVQIKYLVSLVGIELEIKFYAKSDLDTTVSLTNHTYFTLGSKDISELSLRIDADQYLEVDEELIAIKKQDVNEVMDFRKEKAFTDEIDNEMLHFGKLNGYDHYFYFSKKGIENNNVSLENNNYKMDIFTDFEGCQIYTSNFKEDFKLFPTCEPIRNSVAIEPSDSFLTLRMLKANKEYKRTIKYVIKEKKEKKAMDDNVIKQEFQKTFGKESDMLFSCGGRFEILGNHTDHNHGLCLAATCNLNITAAVKKTDGLQTVSFVSKGYQPDFVRLSILEPIEEEKGTSKAIIRGVAEYLKSHGYNIGGFLAYSESSIFKGAGVSSSAAFELLVGQIFNDLYNEGKISRLELCKAGQYAENKYFGKASGLLDQIGVGYGNISYIDFKDINNPNIEHIPFVFDDLSFVIINTGGSHAHLSHLYSQIPQDMYNAAKKAGVNFLRDTTLERLEKEELSEMELNRAKHFYSENERVKKAVAAIKNKDKETFLRMINESRISSTNQLKNMMVEDEYEGSPLEACDYFMKVTEGKGAIKINGGGFAGSVIAVVPKDILEKTISLMAEKYGRENVVEVFVRENGPIKKI